MKSIYLGPLAAILFFAQVSTASQSYNFTGVVSEVSAKTITLRNGGESMEFDRASAHVKSAIHVGDKLTVSYTLNARKITPPKRQEPGRVGSPLDDRAFYFS